MANEQENFTFCPKCGLQKTVSYPENRHWVCSHCGFNLFNNVAAAVGVIISDGKGNVLFEVRAKNPGKGLLTIPGGFVDPDESAEQAAIRECKEEAGITPASLRFLCSYPNTYKFDHITYKTCDIFFTAEYHSLGDSDKGTASAKNGFLQQLTAQQSEVTDFVLEPVLSEADIERLPLAFDSVRKALRTYVAYCNSPNFGI